MFVHLSLSILSVIILCISPFNSATATEKDGSTLKIITYNVLYGFNHRKNKEQGIAWLKEQDADVVALQELNGIGAKGLKTIAAQWGHSHAEILKEDGFPVGLCSKTPIEVIEKRKKDMWHGYLHCKTKGIHFIVVHLSPFRYAFRQKEAKLISSKIEKLLQVKEKVIVLGDFNSLSKHDDSIYTKNETLLQHFIKKEKEKSKIRNLNNGTFDYSVMQTLNDAGLIDAHALSQFKTVPRHTFPSKIITLEKRTDYLRRIDYILIGKQMANSVQDITTAHDSMLDSVSDHYPIVLTLK